MFLKATNLGIISWEKALAEENLDWIFINRVPMLCEKTRIAKQQKIETWLNLHQLAKKLKLLEKTRPQSVAPINYVV